MAKVCTFYPDKNYEPGNNFNFDNTTDLDITVMDDGVSIRMDEHWRHTDGGYASVFIPKENWPEFLRRLNTIKF